MWTEIILAFAPSVLDALGTSLLKWRETSKLKKQIAEITSETFEDFADTTLDTDAFYKLVKSTKFVEIIRNYFLMLKDNLSVSEYKSIVSDLIKEDCPTANILDISSFINKLEELYTNYLRIIVEEYPGISAAFQLMSISHREIISRICDSKDEIRRYLSVLSERKTSISDENIKLYHSVAEKEYGTIRFTGISGAERKKAQNINEFYVENTFSYFGNEIEKLYKKDLDEIENVKLKNFFDFGNRVILIGGAGLGKTTTLNYLFCNYENLYDAKALKLKLDLKEYAEELGHKKKGVLWCIANEFRKRIKYSGETTDEMQAIVAQKLESGKCLIILDALDEIPTQSLRNTVRTEIETFTSVYYLNRFIISTREAGYLKNRFDDRFLHIRINNFNDTQIEQYSKNWFISSHEEDESFEEFWEKFNTEVIRARCQTLIGNPIILVLALIIFDFESRLPNKRIEFYQKCIDTFLTEREDRKAAMALDDKTKTILTMNLVVPKIAYFRYDKIKDNASYRFSYDELKKSIMQAIDVEDDLNWNNAVNQYTQYLVERTELVHEVDEDVFDFAHKTFYEYFLAFYFVKVLDNESISKLLERWIGDSNYDELSRIIIEIIIQNNDPKQHDCIIGLLFNMLTQSENNSELMRNREDVFSVLLDLYTHNLLHPKFHYKYNEFITYNSKFIERIHYNIRRSKIQQSGKLYDVECASEIFLKEFNKNNLETVIDSLKYLNNEFRNKVSSFDTTRTLYYICRLFSIRNNTVRDEKSEALLLKYFLTEKLDYTLLYPQIFISVISLLLTRKDEFDVNGLTKYLFKPQNVFFNYFTPLMLGKLKSKAVKDKFWLAIYLILVVDCGYSSSNMIFDFTMQNLREPSSDTNAENTFYIGLWKTLNSCELYDEFVMFLQSQNSYDKHYESVYKKTFNHYIKNEKGKNEERVIKSIELITMDKI